MRVSVLAPTRARPHLAVAMAKSLFASAEDPDNVELLVYMDDDDPTTEDGLRQFEEAFPEGSQNLVINVGPHEGLGKAWNTLAYMANGRFLSMGNDDLEYKTKGWDTALDRELVKFPDEIVCMFFNDQLNRQRQCAFPTITRKWYETVNHFTGEYFHFFWHDTWIEHIAKDLGRLHYISDVIVTHHHHKRGNVRDATVQARVRAAHQSDGKIFMSEELKAERAELAERLKKHMVG